MKRYIQTAYRHWWLYLPALLILTGASLAGTAAVVRRVASYQSEAHIWVSEPPLQQVLGGGSNSLITPAQERNDMLYQLIQTDWFITSLVDGTPLKAAMTGNPQADADLILKIRAGILIRVIGTNSLTVSYQDSDPALAQQILQNILEKFRSWLTQSQVEQTNAVTTYYQGQLTAYQQQLGQARSALNSFTSQNPGISSSDVVAQAQLQQLQSQVDTAQQLVTSAQTKLQEAQLSSSVTSSAEDSTAFRILDAPTKPIAPQSPLKKALKYLVLGLGATVFIVFGGLIFHTWSDTGVWTVEELEQIQLTVLASVPRLPRQKRSRRRSDADSSKTSKSGADHTSIQSAATALNS